MRHFKNQFQRSVKNSWGGIKYKTLLFSSFLKDSTFGRCLESSCVRIGVWETLGGGEAWKEPIHGRPPWRTARAVQQRRLKRFGCLRLPSSPLCLNSHLSSPRWRCCARSTVVTHSKFKKTLASDPEPQFFTRARPTDVFIAFFSEWSNAFTTSDKKNLSSKTCVLIKCQDASYGIVSLLKKKLVCKKLHKSSWI